MSDVRPNELGGILKARRGILGRTRRSPGSEFGVEESCLAPIEIGRRKLRTGFVGQLAATQGFAPRELSIQIRPDTTLFFSASNRASSNSAKTATGYWQQFAANRMLLKRYRVTERELRVLKHYFSASSLLPQEYIALLVLIRDISETSTDHAPAGSRRPVSLVQLQAAIEYLLDVIKLACSKRRKTGFCHPETASPAGARCRASEEQFRQI
jgi:hypothetical protein